MTNVKGNVIYTIKLIQKETVEKIIFLGKYRTEKTKVKCI